MAKEYLLYNTVTHDTVTLCDYSDEACIAELQKQGYYMLSEDKYGDKYQYPAIYKAPGIVWDQSDDKQINGDWMMTSRESDAGHSVDGQSHDDAHSHDDTHSHDDDHKQNKSAKGLNYTLYNSQTHENYSLSSGLDDSDWMLLDKSAFPDYNQPAVYNTTTHTALDQDTDASGSGGWMIVSQYKDTYTSSADSIDKLDFQSEIASFKLQQTVTMGEEDVSMCIVGTEGKDKIIGSDFSEVLIGGSGKNVLTGGTSADGFLFDKSNDFGAKAADKIKDFNTNEGDQIMLDKEFFGIGKKPKLEIVSSKSDLKKSALSGKDLVYFQDKGLLYFNENGKDNGWGDGGSFVKLIGSPDLNVNDLTII